MMAGMKLITGCIFAKNLPRTRDLYLLGASGVAAHSGCEVRIHTSEFRAVDWEQGFRCFVLRDFLPIAPSLLVSRGLFKARSL